MERYYVTVSLCIVTDVRWSVCLLDSTMHRIRYESLLLVSCLYPNMSVLLLAPVHQGGYIFYAGASLAGAGYCRQCRRRPAILPLQLRQGCQVRVKIFAQRLPRVAQFNAC